MLSAKTVTFKFNMNGTEENFTSTANDFDEYKLALQVQAFGSVILVLLGLIGIVIFFVEKIACYVVCRPVICICIKFYFK